MTNDELETMILKAVIIQELERQADLPQCNTPHVDARIDNPIANIDGDIDLDKLVSAITGLFSIQ